MRHIGHRPRDAREWVSPSVPACRRRRTAVSCRVSCSPPVRGGLVYNTRTSLCLKSAARGRHDGCCRAGKTNRQRAEGAVPGARLQTHGCQDRSCCTPAARSDPCAWARFERWCSDRSEGGRGSQGAQGHRRHRPGAHVCVKAGDRDRHNSHCYNGAQDDLELVQPAPLAKDLKARSQVVRRRRAALREQDEPELPCPTPAARATSSSRA